VIARPLPSDDDRYDGDRRLERRPARPGGTRSGRAAVVRRRARSQRERYRGLATIVGGISTLVLVVVVYLGLMANVTRMNYELANLADQRATLLDETAANDDAIASASSDERLERAARRLGMHEPQRFAAVTLPQTTAPSAPHGVAFLGWLK
jgi:ABC-type Fe3+ transport system permease subunit